MTAESDVLSMVGTLLLFVLLAICIVGAIAAFQHFRQYISLLAIVILAGMASGCALERVPPGWVGIQVALSGSDRGVQHDTIVTGWVFYNPFAYNIYQFPIFMQQATWSGSEAITFNSKESAPVNADLFIAYQFEAAKIPDIFQKYRQEADAITHGYIRQVVRDAIGRHAERIPIMEIIGGGRARLQEEAVKDLQATLGPEGFHIDSISFVNALRVDDKVMASVNQAIEATQRAIKAQNEIMVSKAEADKKVAEAKGAAEARMAIAKAEADANRMIAQSLSPELVQYYATQKWNGELPKVSSNAVPFVHLPSMQ